MSEWRPIETAPKDGTRVALWIPYTADTEEICADQGYWDADVETHRRSYHIKGCWRFDGDDGPFDIQPTKWRPL
jgi:hypothetical protein